MRRAAAAVLARAAAATRSPIAAGRPARSLAPRLGRYGPCRGLGAAPLPADADFGKDYVVFPRESPSDGLHYDLNWSLVDDGVVVGGTAVRNAPVDDLVKAVSALAPEHAAGSVDAASVGRYSTDDVGDRDVMDIDEFEARFEAATDRLHLVAPRLHPAGSIWVEDASVGSGREASLRVRVISDSPDYALYARHMLVPVPQRNPQTVQRHITVVVSSHSGDGTGDCYTVSDWDEETGRATVLVSGSVPLSEVAEQIAHVADRLYNLAEPVAPPAEGEDPVAPVPGSGFAAVQAAPGGGVRIAMGREAGTLHVPDAPVRTALPGGVSPDPLLLRNAAAIVGPSGSALVVGAAAGDLAAQAGTGSLFSAHASVWGNTGLHSFFGGATLASSALADAPAGALTNAGAVTVPVESTTLVAAHPKAIVLVGRGGGAAGGAKAPKKKAAKKSKKEFSSGAASGAEKLAAALQLDEAGAARLAARLDAHGTKVVEAKSFAEATKLVA